MTQEAGGGLVRSELDMYLDYPACARLADDCQRLRLGYCTTQPATPLDISEYIRELQHCLDSYRRTERHLLNEVRRLEHTFKLPTDTLELSVDQAAILFQRMLLMQHLWTGDDAVVYGLLRNFLRRARHHDLIDENAAH